MKRIIAGILLAIFLTSPMLAVDEYVFSEAELRGFLQENIQQAVDKAIADLARDHAIEIIQKNSLIALQDTDIDKKTDELRTANAKVVKFTLSGFLLGAVVGLFAGVLGSR